MKAFIPSWLNTYGLPQSDFRVYCCLASRADSKTGIAWPKAETIASDCMMARNTVWKAIRSLESKGLIRRLGKPFQGRNRYQVLTAPIGANQIPIEGDSIGANGIPIEQSPIGAIETPPIGANEIRQSAQMDSRECNPKKVIHRMQSNKSEKPKTAFEPSLEAMQFASWFKTSLPDSVNLASNWQKTFAKVYDELVRIDGRKPEDIQAICRWARTDSFWQSNFMTPAKLRKKNRDGIQYFDVLNAKMQQATTSMATTTTVNLGHRKPRFPGIQEDLASQIPDL